MRNLHRLFVPVLVLAILALATACSAGLADGHPLERAAAVERQACSGGYPVDEDPRITSPEIVTEVRAFTVDPPAGKALFQQRIIGARLRFTALPGLTAEWIQRSLECHSSRLVLGRARPLPNDPYWLPDSWVAVSVQSQGDGFLVTLRGDSPEAGGNILLRARAFAAAGRAPAVEAKP